MQGIDLGTVVVGFPVRGAFTLLNQSDGVLRYAIGCNGGGGGAPMAAAPKTPRGFELGPFGPMADPLKQGPLFSVDQPEGILPARHVIQQ